jgi:hypothetical protein
VTYEVIKRVLFVCEYDTPGVSIYAKYSNAAAVERGRHDLRLGWAISFHIQGSIAEFKLL